MTTELIKLTEWADGIRADMAMLMLNRIFRDVWGHVVLLEMPKDEFWSTTIRAIKSANPDFLFLAEAYWNTEEELKRLGFDFMYDKKWYDALQKNILPPPQPLTDGIHFIENHDEGRALTVFGRQRSMAAAVALMTVPGMRLIHQGQMEGEQIRIPVQLARMEQAPLDEALLAFYRRLLVLTDDALFHEGVWQNIPHADVLAWCWKRGRSHVWIVIRYADTPIQTKLHLDLDGDNQVTLEEYWSGRHVRSSAKQLKEEGLDVALDAWGFAAFCFSHISLR